MEALNLAYTVPLHKKMRKGYYVQNNVDVLEENFFEFSLKWIQKVLETTFI